MNLKKILIADDHPVVRNSIQLLIKVNYPCTEFAQASNGKEALLLYHQNKPDLLILDYHMPEMNGYELAEQILKKKPDTRIILMSMFDRVTIIKNLIKIGVMGFVSKASPADQLEECIRVVSMGEHYISTDFDQEIQEWLSSAEQLVPKLKFTPIEKNIIDKIVQGKSTKQIGIDLNLSSRTIETYRYDLLKKTNVKNTAEFINYLHSNGILI